MTTNPDNAADILAEIVNRHWLGNPSRQDQEAWARGHEDRGILIALIRRERALAEAQSRRDVAIAEALRNQIRAQTKELAEQADSVPRTDPVSDQHHYRHSTDSEEPMVRLHVQREGLGLVDIYEAKMTSSNPGAEELDVHDRLVLTPEQARWLRATLNSMDLQDDAQGDA